MARDNPRRRRITELQRRSANAKHHALQMPRPVHKPVVVIHFPGAANQGESNVVGIGPVGAAVGMKTAVVTDASDYDLAASLRQMD